MAIDSSSAAVMPFQEEAIKMACWHYIAIRALRLDPPMVGTGLTSTRLPRSVENSSDFPETVQVGLGLADAINLLTWRFLGGAAHFLGTECQAIVGCRDVCERG